MYLKQIYTGNLSEATYFVESNGEAMVIDPLRDTEAYLELAEAHHSKIKFIFETHFHADFVSGPPNLSRQTGAPIIFGPGTKASFPFHQAKDGEIFKVGALTIEAIHTPGHTWESTCYLLRDETGKPCCIFTGDTLFVGDIGRPDLSYGNMTGKELASMMFDTLLNKIMPLADDIIVYPAHGAEPGCGKNPGTATFTTIGEQKRTNYALQPQSKEAFITAVTKGLVAPAPNLSLNARMNKEGPESLNIAGKKGLIPLSVKEIKSKIYSGITVLDTRPAADFIQGYIPGSLFIGPEERLADFAGRLLRFDQPLVLIACKGKEEEAIVRLAGLGFEHVEGYLEGGFQAWERGGENIDMIISIETDELAIDIPFDENLLILDVRKENEFAEGHVKGALNLPLGQMADIVQIAQLEENQNIYIHCEGGFRSVIAASILKKHGYNNIRKIEGGWSKIKDQKNITTEKEASVLN